MPPKALTVIVLTVLAITLTTTTFAALSVNKSLNSTGNISVTVGLNIYSDSNCTVPISSINWGNLTCGQNCNQTIYVKNTGSGTSLNLSMTTSNWSPTNAANYLLVTWNREGQRIQPNQVLPAILTLNSSSSTVDITNFSVQISIAGTQ